MEYASSWNLEIGMKLWRVSKTKSMEIISSSPVSLYYNSQFQFAPSTIYILIFLRNYKYVHSAKKTNKQIKILFLSPTFHQIIRSNVCSFGRESTRLSPWTNKKINETKFLSISYWSTCDRK